MPKWLITAARMVTWSSPAFFSTAPPKATGGIFTCWRSTHARALSHG